VDVQGFKICGTGCSDSLPCPANNTCLKKETGSFCYPYVPEISGATCNLTYQAGCDRMSGVACDVTSSGSTFSAACVPHSGQVPVGSICSSATDCEAGSMCHLGVCRHFCDSSVERDGCDQGTCFAPPITGGKAAFELCYIPCRSDSECGSGRQCSFGSLTAEVGLCRVGATDTCTVNDGECDEPRPRGTGICAPGYDTADCMVTP
jgi:hypothetical protein